MSHILSTLRHCSRKLLHTLASLLPGQCALCRSHSDTLLCGICQHHYFQQHTARCPVCANPLFTASTGLPCGSCLKKPHSFDATVAVTDYAPPVDQLIQSFKFAGNLPLAELMAELMYQALLKARLNGTTLPDMLVAVPLSRERLIQRGFNQSLEISKALSEKLSHIPLISCVIRTHDTGMQSKSTFRERRKNMRDAFMIPSQWHHSLAGKHIGLVDDVMTTGATLDALADTFKRAGARRVTALVFARTPP